MITDEELTLGKLAAVAGLGPDHFGRAFRTSTGLSPFRYVAQRRVHKAKEQLMDTDLSIREIALSLG